MKFVHCFNNHNCELVFPYEWLKELILVGDPAKISVQFFDRIHQLSVIRTFDHLRIEDE